jgi:diaminohydroxyphosphoribosylaminopyrimidine deaminase/5-amino-6-(5-phosphoribosylamino)uracil reductase
VIALGFTAMGHRSNELSFMRAALHLARRAYGQTSPNPMVGAVLVKKGEIIGRGWHHCAGQAHAEIKAICNAQWRQQNPKGATLYVTLEPCCTYGRTPPCTDAIIAAGIKRVVIAAGDPNPAHAGEGLKILEHAGISVTKGLLAEEATLLNETFNHWIVHRTPFVTVKAAMSLDGKIATVSGESKWITGEKARAYGMKLRQGADAILVGINTILKDDPSLTLRTRNTERGMRNEKRLRRIVLDPQARTPVQAKVVSDEFAHLTTLIVTKAAPRNRLAALAKHVKVIVAPTKSQIANRKSQIDLPWLLKKLGAENITSLLVEGGGETNALFLLPRAAQRVAFFYAPIVLGGRTAPKGTAGEGIARLEDKITLREVEWRRLGMDLLLTARVDES